MKLKCGGLFSGIGGFELAAQWAGMENVWSNEIDEYCCKVLRKNFNHEIIEADIRDCGKGRKHELRSVDVIFGGFPCQPFSTAGKRGGEKDDRYLWPEMLRIISEVRPTWVIGENVAGILSMGKPVRKPKVESRTIARTPEVDHYEAVLSLEEEMLLENICKDLEKIGYQVQPFIIPACAKGAPHRRDRVWIVAHSQCSNEGRNTGILSKENGREQLQQQQSVGKFSITDKTYRQTTANNAIRVNGKHNREQEEGQEHEPRESVINSTTTNANSGRQQRESRTEWFSTDNKQNDRRQWQKHWYEAATRLCGTPDGLPSELDKLRNADRTNRLKALGNAIVPQVAFEILNAIRIINENENQSTNISRNYIVSKHPPKRPNIQKQ